MRRLRPDQERHASVMLERWMARVGARSLEMPKVERIEDQSHDPDCRRFELGDMHHYRMNEDGQLAPISPEEAAEPAPDGSTGRVVAVDQGSGYVRVEADD